MLRRHQSSGVAILDGKLFRTTLDANVVGHRRQDRQGTLGDRTPPTAKLGYSMTMAPLGRGRRAHDRRFRRRVRHPRFHRRLGSRNREAPLADLIRSLPRANPAMKPGERGHWKHGGGSTWITGSFDPEAHTVYWGVGNPGPFNAATRPGDNLYTCSVLALDPKTGSIKWYYQFSPNNPFDYDAVAEMVLADIKVDGKPTKAILDVNRNGFLYVLDRATGKPIAANPYMQVNWASSIDLKTGRPVETDVAAKARAGEEVALWPSVIGGKNWEPMSYDPDTGLAYANVLNFGSHYKTAPGEYKAGEWYIQFDLTKGWDWPKGPRGYLKALDPMTGKAEWEQPSDIPRMSEVPRPRAGSCSPVG